jgi:hypothetical protein
MEKQKLILLCNHTHDWVGNFYKYYSKENIDSTLSNWNAKDVLGHILFWMNHCGNKIYHIKKGLPFEMVDAYKENDKNYLKNKIIKIDKIFEDINNVIFNCINVIDMYTEKELLDKTLSTGYSFEMWRYIAMDMHIHPIKHLLHYYLKLENHNEFDNIITHSLNDFMEYSNNDINVYNFQEFYDDCNEREKQFIKLKSTNKNNGIIKEIIEINII